MRTALLLFALAGCEQNLLAELHDARIDASAAHLLYMNTEGLTLHKGSPNSQTDTTDLITADSVLVPPFLDGMSDRQAFIDQIVQLSRDALAPYSIDIVPTRPATGAYLMVVFGGDPVAVSGLNPSAEGITNFSCAVISNAPSVVFDHGTTAPATPSRYATNLLSHVGSSAGLGLTTAPGDCQCRIDPGCETDAVCTFGAAAPTSNLTDSSGVAYNCGRTPTQDEPEILELELGAH